MESGQGGVFGSGNVKTPRHDGVTLAQGVADFHGVKENEMANLDVRNGSPFLLLP
jgi:hypothetical protein